MVVTITMGDEDLYLVVISTAENIMLKNALNISLLGMLFHLLIWLRHSTPRVMSVIPLLTGIWIRGTSAHMTNQTSALNNYEPYFGKGSVIV